MRYIQKFSTSGAVQEALENSLLGKPYVAYVEDGQYIDWDSQEIEIDYSSMPLTFKVLSGGTIWWQMGNNTGIPQTTIYYSTDSGSTWNQLVSDTAETAQSEISVNAGDVIQFGGFNECYANRGAASSIATAYENGNHFAGTAVFDAYGNMLSMTDRDNYQQLTGFTSSGAFACVFATSNVVNAKNLVIPDFMEYGTCANMFIGCSMLETAPALPATLVPRQCYVGMFRNCTSLTTPPVLPATTGLGGCYTSMFNGCTSLEVAPELPMTVATNLCYSSMFKNTKIRTAPELPATVLQQSCYANMFEGCTELTASPVLPVDDISNFTQKYYFAMFSGCTKLTEITCLATKLSSTTNNWTAGVSPTGTFYKAPGVEWPTGPSGIPDGWTVVDADI